MKVEEGESRRNGGLGEGIMQRYVKERKGKETRQDETSERRVDMMKIIIIPITTTEILAIIIIYLQKCID